MDKLVFDLKTPIKVQIKLGDRNEFQEISQLFLSAPSYKHKDKTLFLKKKFIEAIFSMTTSLQKQEAEQQVGDGKLDAKAIKAVLFAAREFDIVSYFKQFESLLLSVGFKDENMEQPLNNLDVQKLDESDYEELLAKYLEVFFITSWMKTLS